MRTTFVAGAALVAAMVVAACGGSDSGSAAKSNVIRIGFMGPLHGSTAQLGTETQKAAKLAVDEVNAQGGVEVNGKKWKVQLISEDEGDRVTDDAVAGAQRLVSKDNVSVFVGGTNSSGILAYMPILEREGIPALDTVGKAHGIEQAIIDKKMAHWWIVNPTTAELAKEHTKLWNALVHPQRMSFMQVDADATHDLEDEFKADFKAAGMNVQTQFLYAEPTVNDFGSYILKIKQFHPDAIWVSLVGNPTYSWARQLAQSGYKGYVLTGDAEYQSAQFLEKEGQDANYALTNAVTYPTAVTPKTLPFYKAYQKATGIYPAAYYAVNEYDGMQAAFEAMRRSGGLTGDTKHDRAAIQKGLESITQQKPFEGIRGTAEFFAPLEQGHHMVGTNIVIAQIQNGKQVPVWPEDVASAAGTKFVDPRTH